MAVKNDYHCATPISGVDATVREIRRRLKGVALRRLRPPLTAYASDYVQEANGTS
jgi:hypothetical protein